MQTASRLHRPRLLPGSASRVTTAALAAVASLFGFAAHAESDINSGTGAGVSATADLNMRIRVPRMIFLRVGNGTNFADNATIQRVTFAVTGANVGSGVAVAGTPAAGIQAMVRANGGNVNFTARGVLNGLAKGTRRIPWTQIVPTATGTLPHPVIGNGVAGAASVLTAVNGVVNQTATYNFTYSNSTPMEFGSYNGRVTYTASLP
jgi:hypothetical protein